MTMVDMICEPRMQLMCIGCRKKEWRPLAECATGDTAPLSSCCGLPTVATAVES